VQQNRAKSKTGKWSYPFNAERSGTDRKVELESGVGHVAPPETF